MRALIEEDPARARQFITRLANSRRCLLQNGEVKVGLSEDELRVANDYLALEQVLFEDLLRLRVDVEPDTLALSGPPMLLETVVENALQERVSERAEGGEIAITAGCERGVLRPRETNSGELAKVAAKARATSTGVVLHNKAERLGLLFGERASLRLASFSPLLVVAEAIVPPQVSRG